MNDRTPEKVTSPPILGRSAVAAAAFLGGAAVCALQAEASGRWYEILHRVFSVHILLIDDQPRWAAAAQWGVWLLPVWALIGLLAFPRTRRPVVVAMFLLGCAAYYGSHVYLFLRQTVGEK